MLGHNPAHIGLIQALSGARIRVSLLRAKSGLRDGPDFHRFQATGIRFQELDACSAHEPIARPRRNLALSGWEPACTPGTCNPMPETFFGTDSQRAFMRSSILLVCSRRSKTKLFKHIKVIRSLSRIAAGAERLR